MADREVVPDPHIIVIPVADLDEEARQRQVWLTDLRDWLDYHRPDNVD